VKNKVLLLAIIVALAVIGERATSDWAWGTVHGPKRAETRRLAPDFSLTDVTGHTLTLSRYRGKVILLDFWATWCDPCREEIPRFVELQNKYRDRGLQIIGISMDDTSGPVRDFYRQFKMNYPVALGNAKIGELYGGVLGLPIAFLIDREGRIYAKHIGATEISVLENEIKALL
jgi:peroxiredoxin